MELLKRQWYRNRGFFRVVGSTYGQVKNLRLPEPGLSSLG